MGKIAHHDKEKKDKKENKETKKEHKKRKRDGSEDPESELDKLRAELESCSSAPCYFVRLLASLFVFLFSNTKQQTASRIPCYGAPLARGIGC